MRYAPSRAARNASFSDAPAALAAARRSANLTSSARNRQERLLPRIGGDSGERRAEADCGRDRLQGMGERVQQAAGAAQQGGDRPRVSPHLRHQEIGRCRPLGERDRRLRLLQGRLAAPGMELREELKSAHAVGG